MAWNNCITILMYVQISHSFQITNCSNYNLVRSENETIEIGCTTSEWYGYCSLQHQNSQQTCTFTIWNNLIYGYRGHADTNCLNFPQIIQFKGIPDTFNCRFEISMVNIKDDDTWMITMQDWYNTFKVSSEKFAFEAQRKETGCLDKDAKFVGSDLVRSEIKSEDVIKNSWKDCRIHCSRTENCSFWSWESNRSCFLKNNDAINHFVYSNTTMSGSSDCASCHKLDDILEMNKARSFGLNSCANISHQTENFIATRFGFLIYAFFGSMIFAAVFFGVIFLYHYIIVARVRGRPDITSTKARLSMLNHQYEDVEYVDADVTLRCPVQNDNYIYMSCTTVGDEVNRPSYVNLPDVNEPPSQDPDEETKPLNPISTRTRVRLSKLNDHVQSVYVDVTLRQPTRNDNYIYKSYSEIGCDENRPSYVNVPDVNET